jgi:hypothetical protein
VTNIVFKGARDLLIKSNFIAYLLHVRRFAECITFVIYPSQLVYGADTTFHIVIRRKSYILVKIETGTPKYLCLQTHEFHDGIS